MKDKLAAFRSRVIELKHQNLCAENGMQNHSPKKNQQILDTYIPKYLSTIRTTDEVQDLMHYMRKTMFCYGNILYAGTTRFSLKEDVIVVGEKISLLFIAQRKKMSDNVHELLDGGICKKFLSLWKEKTRLPTLVLTVELSSHSV